MVAPHQHPHEAGDIAAETMVDQASLAVSVAKLTAGHEQVQAGRMADLHLLERGYARALALHGQLEADLEVLTRYGHAMPEVADRMRQEALFAAKALEHATQVVGALVAQDPVLTPASRRAASD